MCYKLEVAICDLKFIIKRESIRLKANHLFPKSSLEALIRQKYFERL